MKLLLCPFCRFKAHVVAQEPGRGFRVWCGFCTTLGPFATSREDAARRWNRRTKSAWYASGAAIGYGKDFPKGMPKKKGEK